LLEELKDYLNSINFKENTMNDVERILENLRGGLYGQIDLNKFDLSSAIRKAKELMEVDPIRKVQLENDLRKMLNDLGEQVKSDQLTKDIATARYLTGKK